MNDAQVRDRIGALETAIERLPQEAGETVELLVGIYGETLRRILVALGAAPDLRQRVASDELVAHVLVLHGLHPCSIEERVTRALDEVRPYIGGHGGAVELTGIEGDVAYVRLSGTCESCAASIATLKLAVQKAVLRAAPELRAVEAAEPAAAAS